MLYFSFSATWGYIVLSKTDYLPPFLGGPPNGSFKNIELSTIFVEYPEALRDYSLFTMGYHLHDLIIHAFVEERMNDFEEMLLHHIAAISLYFCYIFGNMLGVGSVIAFLHDLADILGKASKLLNSTIYQNGSVVAFLCCICVWGYTRIFWLPQMIYFIFTDLRFKGDLQQF